MLGPLEAIKKLPVWLRVPIYGFGIGGGLTLIALIIGAIFMYVSKISEYAWSAIVVVACCIWMGLMYDIFFKEDSYSNCYDEETLELKRQQFNREIEEEKRRKIKMDY